MSVADLPPLPPTGKVIGPPPGWTPPPPPPPAAGPTIAPAPLAPPGAPGGSPLPPPPGSVLAPPPPPPAPTAPPAPMGPPLSPPVLSPPPPPAATGPALSAPVAVSDFAVPVDTVDIVMEETQMVSRSRHIVLLDWDDGTQTRVNVPTRIGRNPAKSDNERAVAIADDTSSLSKTHARLNILDSGPVIEDMHSTNGVQIERGGVRFALTPEVPAALQSGDVLVFGLRKATVVVDP